MEHWTKQIDVEDALLVAEILGMPGGTAAREQNFIEDVAVALMGCIREPWLFFSDGYDTAVDFYHACQSAVWGGRVQGNKTGNRAGGAREREPGCRAGAAWREGWGAGAAWREGWGAGGA